jgi:hypothetical protein
MLYSPHSRQASSAIEIGDRSSVISLAVSDVISL